MPFIEQQLTANGVTEEGRHVASEALFQIITNSHVSSMSLAVSSPESSGYAVGDTFRLNVGTPVQVNGDDFHATGRVTAIGSPETDGRVTAIEIISSGAYTALPSQSPLVSPENLVTALATTTLTGAGDDTLKVDVLTAVPTWTQDALTIDSPIGPGSYEWTVSSTKAANGATIGGRSELSGVDDGLRFTIGSSYSGILPWDGQPGVPPTDTFYVGVPNQNPKLYVSVTERRINVMITDGTYKQYANMGLFIPFTDVASNYPFPGIICAQSTALRAFAEVFNSSNQGIVNPIDFSGLGCYQYRDNLSTVWYGMTANNQNGADVCRANIWPNTGNLDTYAITHAPVPTGSSAPSADMDPEITAQACNSFEEDKWFTADQTTFGNRQGPQPLGIGGQMHFTVQPHIVSNQPGDVQLIGLIDGFESVHGRGLTAFDEIQNQDGRRYIVFNDTQSSDLTNWVAMEMI